MWFEHCFQSNEYGADDMREPNRLRAIVGIVLLSCLLPAAAGCDQSVAAQVLTLSTDYLGDVFAAVATSHLQNILGLDPGGEEHEGSHHAAGPLHDYEH